jgi:hypothetical protein
MPLGGTPKDENASFGKVFARRRERTTDAQDSWDPQPVIRLILQSDVLYFRSRRRKWAANPILTLSP